MEKYNIVFILKFFFRYKNEIHSHIVKVGVRNRRKKKKTFFFILFDVQKGNENLLFGKVCKKM